MRVQVMYIASQTVDKRHSRIAISHYYVLKKGNSVEAQVRMRHCGVYLGDFTHVQTRGRCFTSSPQAEIEVHKAWKIRNELDLRRYTNEK